MAGFSYPYKLLEAVQLNFHFTLREADEQSITQWCSNAANAATVVTTRESARRQSAVTRALLRVAHVDDSSVQFTTSYRLLPNLIIPLSTRLGRRERQPQPDKQTLPYDLSRTAFTLVFDMADSDEHVASRAPLSIDEVLNYHQQRVPGDDSAGSGGNDSVIVAFTALYPTAQLSSLQLMYRHGLIPSITVELAVQSDANMQMSGFHIIRPRLHFHQSTQPHSGAATEQRAVIEGQARATYVVAGSEVVGRCTADVSITARYSTELSGKFSLRMSGDCLSVMRMGDILTAATEQSTAQSTTTSTPSASSSSIITPPTPSSSCHTHPLSSHTILSYTVDSLLARQLPWLVLCDAPLVRTADETHAGQAEAWEERWNQLECCYRLGDHIISDVINHNVSLAVSPPSPSLSSSPAHFVLLSTTCQQQEDQFAQFQLRLVLPPQLPYTTDYAASEPLSLNRLLALFGMPSEAVPDSSSLVCSSREHASRWLFVLELTAVSYVWRGQ